VRLLRELLQKSFDLLPFAATVPCTSQENRSYSDFPSHPTIFYLVANFHNLSEIVNDARRYSRFICPKGTLSAWQGGGRKLVSFIGNLSLGGLYLRTPDPPSRGTTLQLLLDLPEGQVRARGLVEWKAEKRGMGIKFIAMQHEDRGRLGKWLRTLAT